MAEWLRPLKILENVEHPFSDMKEAERQLYLAVIRGEVRASACTHKLRLFGIAGCRKRRVRNNSSSTRP